MSTKQNKSTGTSSFRAFTVLVRQQEVHPACKSLLKLFPTVLLKDATKPRATQELKLTACWTKNMKKAQLCADLKQLQWTERIHQDEYIQSAADRSMQSAAEQDTATLFSLSLMVASGCIRIHKQSTAANTCT